MKYLFKKFWIVIVFALVVNVPLVIFGVVRTDYSVTLKGDTTPLTSVIDVEYDYVEEGSFSSIYVISFEHSTILQNMFLEYDETSTISKMSYNESRFTDLENYQMGQIQKNSSIMASIIVGYRKAKQFNSEVNIEIADRSLCVTYYDEKSQFRIGDEIIGVNGHYITTDFTYFASRINTMYVGDTFNVIRNNTEIEIVVDENSINQTIDGKYYYRLGFYRYYDINYDTIYPKVKTFRTNTGGPSAGLLQALSVFNKLTKKDYTYGLKISGTGTINPAGTVGAIGGIRQKIATAFDDGVDIFFCPAANYDEALIAYNSLINKEKMKLVKVSTFNDAISYLEGVSK